MNDIETARRLGKIFNPASTNARDELMKHGRRLVHYTSASAALNMIQSNSVWLRNVRCMNDYMEVDHGFSLLHRFFAPETEETPDIGRKVLVEALDEIQSNIHQEAIDLFNGWFQTLKNDTYLACLSEHLDEEDKHGRLSMWRAYGGRGVGVALVINPFPLYLFTDALKAYSNPVSYLTDEQFFNQMRAVSDNVKREADYLRTVPRTQLVGAFFQLLLAASICCKHPGFKEEKEWRIMHVPQLWSGGPLKRTLRVVNDVPQCVYEIPLKDIPEGGVVGIEVPKLINRVIIGPTEFSGTIRQAFVAALEESGMSNAASRVHISGIPLRSSG